MREAHHLLNLPLQLRLGYRGGGVARSAPSSMPKRTARGIRLLAETNNPTSQKTVALFTGFAVPIYSLERAPQQTCAPHRVIDNSLGKHHFLTSRGSECPYRAVSITCHHANVSRLLFFSIEVRVAQSQCLSSLERLSLGERACLAIAVTRTRDAQARGRSMGAPRRAARLPKRRAKLGCGRGHGSWRESQCLLRL
jgi:hypothetical protein